MQTAACSWLGPPSLGLAASPLRRALVSALCCAVLGVRMLPCACSLLPIVEPQRVAHVLMREEPSRLCIRITDTETACDPISAELA